MKLRQIFCFHRWTMLPFNSKIIHKIGCSKCGLYEDDNIYEFDGKGTYTLIDSPCACGHKLSNHDNIDYLHSCNNPRCYCGKFTKL